MPKQIVNISDTIKQFQEKFNVLSTDIGWRGRLQTTEDSDIVGAINEVDYRLDSINSNQINSPHLFIRDSSETGNTIKGGLNIHGELYNRQAVDFDATLNVDGNVTLNSNITLGTDAADNVVFNAEVNSNIVPNTTNTYDLGTSSKEWKDLYVDGIGYIDAIQGATGTWTGLVSSGSLTVSGVTTLNGHVDLGNAAGDNISIIGQVDTNIVPDADDTYDLGTTLLEWRNLYLDGTAYIDTLNVHANADIDGTLNVDGATTLNGNVDLGNATSDTVSVTGRVDTNIVPSTDGTRDLGATTLEWRDLFLDGTAHIDTLDVDQNANIDGELVVGDSAEFRSNVVVDGSVNVAQNLHVTGNTTMGGTLIVDGEVTFKAGTNSNINLGDNDGDNVVFNADVNSHIIPNTDGTYDLGSTTKEWRNLYIDGTGYIDTLAVHNNADVDGNLNVDGNTTLNGNVDLGNATGDTVSVTGRVDTSIVPSTDNARDLGTASLEWRDLYLDGIAHIDKLDVDDSAVLNSTLSVTGLSTLSHVDINNTLDVTDSSSFGNNVSIDGNANIGGTVTSTGMAFKIKADAVTTDDVNLSSTIEFTGGEGIDTVIVDDKHIEISGEDASTTNKGVAKFNTNDFSVSSGNVSIKSGGVSNTQLVNSSFTVADSSGATYTIDLGDSLQLKGEGQKVRVQKGADDVIEFNLDSDVHVDGDFTVGRDATISRNLLISGDLVVSGATKTTAHRFKMGEETTGTPLLNGIISIDRGTEDSAQLLWNETTNYWEAGTTGDMSRIVRENDSAELSDLSVTNDVNIGGNLIVQGTTTTVNSETVTLKDNLILINSTQTGTPLTTLRSGLEVERGDQTNTLLQWNENADTWEIAGAGNTGTIAVTSNIGDGSVTVQGTGALSGSGAFTMNQSNSETVTIQHNTTSRTNNTSTASPSAGGTFTAIDSVTTNTYGHITAVNTKTVTLPAAPFDNYGFWTAADDDGTTYTITSGDTLTYDEGTDLDINFTADDVLTFAHKDTARTNNTSTTSPGAGGSFTAIDSLTTNSRGHVTAVNTKTVTLPTAPFDNYGSWTAADHDGTTYTITSGDTLSFKEGNAIDVNFTADDQLTISHVDTSTLSGTYGGAANGVVIEDITVDGNGHVTGIGTVDLDARFDKYTSWTARDGDGSTFTITSGDILQYAEGTEIDVNFTADDVLTFAHKNVTRSDTTSSSSPGFGGSFGVVGSVTTNARGHVTAVDVETVTLPTERTLDVSLIIYNSAGTAVKTLYGGSSS